MVVETLRGREESLIAARMHIDSIRSGFLSSLGAGFLSEFYMCLSRSGYGTCFICKDADRIIGFVAGTTDLSRFQNEFIRKRFFRVMKTPGFLKKVFSIRVLYGIFEDLFYARRKKIPETELISIAVDSEYRGKGVGQLLMETFLREMIQKKVDTIKVIVGEDNQAAKSFYERHGFEHKEKTVIHKGMFSDVYVKQLRR